MGQVENLSSPWHITLEVREVSCNSTETPDKTITTTKNLTEEESLTIKSEARTLVEIRE